MAHSFFDTTVCEREGKRAGGEYTSPRKEDEKKNPAGVGCLTLVETSLETVPARS
jgi:hypothetical protein